VVLIGRCGRGGLANRSAPPRSRPLGPKAFLERLEKMLGRALVPKKRGPKPKAKAQEA